MLSDFINANKLKSKLINSIEPIHSLTLASKISELNKECIFKSVVFMDELNNVWIVLFPWAKQLNEKKIMQAIPSFDYFLNAKETFDLTGFIEGMVPPISIYGARILMDSSFKNKKRIAGIVETEKLMLILELNELNELIPEIVYAKITK